MKDKNDIKKACENLADNDIAQYQDDSTEIISNLFHLFDDYGYAKVLAALSSTRTIAQTLDLFEKIEWNQDNPKKIKTIGTHYRRMYNGGVEIVLASLMRLWVNMGYRVVLFTDEEANKLDYPYPSEVKRIVIPLENDMLNRLSTLENSILKEEIDVFVNHVWINRSVVYENILCRLLHIPYIVHIHGLYTAICESVNYCYDSYRVFRQCSLVVSLSEISAKYYQMCGCNSYLVQNPIPDKLQNIDASEFDKRCGNKHILWIGRIADGKRIEDAIECFRLVKNDVSDAVLDVVGTGNVEDICRIKERCIRYQLGDSVIFHGYKEDTTRYYMNSALMLMTSEREGYPTVLLESKAYGLPCVMYSLPYLTMVQDKKGIFTTDIGNISKLAEHVVTILRDDELRKKLSSESRESFEFLKAYDLQAVWREIFALSQGNQTVETSERHYDPNVVPESETEMLPMLIDEYKSNAQNMIVNNFDYKVGHMILKFPRVVLRGLRRLKHTLVSR